MPKKTPNPHRRANPDWQRSQHALGSSSATQPHIPGPKKGTRGVRDDKAIRDQRDPI